MRMAGFFFVRKKRTMKKVAIQGIADSYHDVASHRHFEDEAIELVPCDMFKELIGRVGEDVRMN